MKAHIAIIDPGARFAEVECFNALAFHSPFALTYHLPALAGTDSLKMDQRASGIIILGSATSVPDELEWQNTLTDWLQPQMEQGTPTLGLCYGHQLITHMYGGKVEFLTKEKTKYSGVRKVVISPNRLWKEKKSGDLVVSHREGVTEPAKGFHSVGRSDLSAFEVLEHESLNIWTMQPHAEATQGFVTNNKVEVPPKSGAFLFGWSLIETFFHFCSERKP